MKSFVSISSYIRYFRLPKLAPTPRWKLIVDLGTIETPPAAETSIGKETNGVDPNGLDLSLSTHTASVHQHQNGSAKVKDGRVDAVVSLLGEFMPSDPASPQSAYLPGFMSLRLLILRPTRSDAEQELVRTMLDSYESYSKAGRAPKDIAVLLARDCMFLTNAQNQQQRNQTQQQQVVVTQPPPSVPGYCNNNASVKNQVQPNVNNLVSYGQRPTSHGSSNNLKNQVQPNMNNTVLYGQRPSSHGSSNNTAPENQYPAMQATHLMQQRRSVTMPYEHLGQAQATVSQQQHPPAPQQLSPAPQMRIQQQEQNSFSHPVGPNYNMFPALVQQRYGENHELSMSHHGGGQTGHQEQIHRQQQQQALSHQQRQQPNHTYNRFASATIGNSSMSQGGEQDREVKHEENQ
jgi:hypothetical protein